MGIEVARLIAYYGSDYTGFDQGARHVNDTLQKQTVLTQTAFGSFLGNMLASAAGAVAQFGAEALTSYANFERLGYSLESLTARELLNSGAAYNMSDAMRMASPRAQELLGWIQQLAVNSPFKQEGVALAYQQALAYGFTSEEAQRLTRIMIDFAAGSGKSESAMSSIALALGQIQAKGKLSGQEILQLVNNGIPVLAILAKAFGKTTGEVQKMVEDGLVPADAAILAITRSLDNDFGGAAERQAKTFSGLLSSLWDLKDIGLREFFTGTFQEIQPYLEQFVDALSDPAVQASIRGWGDEFGQSVGEIAQGLSDLIGWWSSLDGSTQEAILNFGKLAVAAALIENTMATGLPKAVGTMIQLGTTANGVGTAFGNVAAQIAGATSEGYSLGQSVKAVISSGSLTSAMVTQFGAMAVSIGAATVALTALVAVWYTWNEQIAKTQEQGMEDNANAWADAFAKVEDNGGSAAMVLKTYGDLVQNTNAAHEAGGLAADIFINKQQLLNNGLKEAVSSLGRTAGSWDEYNDAVQAAAVMAGYQVDAQGKVYKIVRDGAGLHKQYADDLGLMTEEQYNAAQAAAELAAAEQVAGEASGTAADEIISLGQATMESKDLMNMLSTSLKDAGWSSAAMQQATDAMALSLGTIDPEVQTLQNDAQLLTQAFANHIITLPEYTSSMLAAKDGTLQLDEAQRTELQAALQQAEANAAARDSAKDAAAAFSDLAMSLKDATGAEIARTSINSLKTALDEGRISPEQYQAAFESIGTSFGLVDEKSLALASSIPALTGLFEEGYIPAQNMDNALAFMAEDAADGTVNLDALVKKFGELPQTAATTTETGIKPIGEAVTTLSNETLPAAGKSVQTFSETMGTAAEEAANAWTQIDWESVGKAVDDGIAAGINGYLSEVIEAARAAAQAVKDTIDSELDIHSPSGEGNWRGQMFMLGQTQGIEQGTPEAVNAVRKSTIAMSGAALGNDSLAGGGTNQGGQGNGLTIYIGDVNYQTAVSTQAEHEVTNLLVPIIQETVRAWWQETQR